MSTKKLWGGRFEESAAAWIDQFGASISFDQLMANEDIEGSLAHVKMLNETGILTEQEATEIENGLLSLKDDLSAGKLEFSDQNEDIHMNIESLLTEKIGPVAGKLHTARSRNDQVATDFHLYVKKRTTAVISELKKLQKALVEKAEANVETIMPGYTHSMHNLFLMRTTCSHILKCSNVMSNVSSSIKNIPTFRLWDHALWPERPGPSTASSRLRSLALQTFMQIRSMLCPTAILRLNF